MQEKLEIERKFLLKGIPLGKWDVMQIIYQYYCYTPAEGNFRIRQIEEVQHLGKLPTTTYLLTKKEKVKSETGYVNKEFEKEITKKQFEVYNQFATKGISKTRRIYKHPVDDLKWEIDFFKFGLIVAEIELPSVNYELVLPEFIKEVLIGEVNSPIFNNFNLAEEI